MELLYIKHLEDNLNKLIKPHVKVKMKENTFVITITDKRGNHFTKIVDEAYKHILYGYPSQMLANDIAKSYKSFIYNRYFF